MTAVLERPRLPATADFTYELYGFVLTSGPPEPSGVEQWASSPTEEMFAESARAFGVAETMSFETATPADCRSIAWTATEYDDYVGAPFYWLMWNTQTWTITLPTVQAYALTFSVRAGGETARTFRAGVAGHEFPHVTIEDSGDFTDIVYHVPAELAVAGAQPFWLRTSSAFLLRSVIFTPIVTATYHWESVKKGIVYAGFTDSITIEAESGTTDTEEQAEAFARSIGVTASVSGEALFVDVSAELNANYAESGYRRTKIEISEFERVTSTSSVTCPDGALSLTYQYWQPVLTFHAPGGSLRQSSARDLLPRRFVEIGALPTPTRDPRAEMEGD